MSSNRRIYGIVDTDNFGGDYPNEGFVVACWLSKTTAESIAKLLNDEAGSDSYRYYKVVEQGYKLQPGFEP
jgi:hypothetical protein